MFTIYLHIGIILCEIVAVLFNVQNFKDEWKDNTFHKQPKMIVKNGKRRFHHCRILLQFGEIYSSEFTERISGTLLGKIFSSFIILTKIGQLFIGIDSSGFKATHASQYYTERIKLTRRRKYIKLSLTDGVMQQIICTIKIRRAPTRHDTIDFQPLITKTSEILPLSVVIGDKGYYGEDNPTLVRDVLYVFGAYRQVVCMNQYEGPVGDTQNKRTMVIPNCWMVNEIRMKL